MGDNIRLKKYLLTLQYNINSILCNNVQPPKLFKYNTHATFLDIFVACRESKVYVTSIAYSFVLCYLGNLTTSKENMIIIIPFG